MIIADEGAAALGAAREQSKGGEASARLPALDLLRIIAALAVVAFHWTWMGVQEWAPARYGYLGVELFFMISGFVIAQSIRGRDRIGFAKARWRRLWPTFVACLAVTLIVAPLGPVDILANLTMIPHLLGRPYADGVYWSLMFEIIFYVAIALVVVKHIGRLRWFAWAWLVLALLPLPGKIGTLVISDFAPFFIVGLAVYLYRAGKPDWLLMAAAVAAALWRTAEQPTGVPWISALVVLACAGATLWATGASFGPRLSRIAFVLGGISYPLYLLHYVVGLAVASAIGRPLALVVVVLASWAIWAADRAVSRGLKAWRLSRPISAPGTET